LVGGGDRGDRPPSPSSRFCDVPGLTGPDFVFLLGGRNTCHKRIRQLIAATYKTQMRKILKMIFLFAEADFLSSDIAVSSRTIHDDNIIVEARDLGRLGCPQAQDGQMHRVALSRIFH
jgi:hypothetical protein